MAAPTAASRTPFPIGIEAGSTERRGTGAAAQPPPVRDGAPEASGRRPVVSRAAATTPVWAYGCAPAARKPALWDGTHGQL
jgi:hypothetical protein